MLAGPKVEKKLCLSLCCLSHNYDVAVKPTLQLRDWSLKQGFGAKNAFMGLCAAPHYVWDRFIK